MNLKSLILSLLVLLFCGPIVAAQSTAPTTKPSQAVVVLIDGVIDEFSFTMLQRRFEEARNLGADTIILRINTYGGLVSAGLDISRFLKRQENLHIIALIDEKAISAGAMIALACDEIYMEPASLIGDVGVIMMGQTIEGDTERAKSESPVLAEFDDSATRNGHDRTMVMSMVQLIRTAYYIENIQTGERKFVERADFESLTTGESPAWKSVEGVPVPLDSETTLLTMGDDLARRVGLSKGTFADADALARDRGLAIRKTLEASAGERLVGWLSGGTVRGIVLAALVLALIYGIKLPGTGVTEVAIVCLLALFFIGPLLTGYGEWYEVLMVLLGVGLLAVELFVLPGFGIAGFTGLALLFTGLVMSFLPPLFPAGLPPMTGVSFDQLRNALLIVLSAIVGSFALWIAFAGSLPRLPGFGRLVLTQAVGSAEAVEKNLTTWPAVGAVGVVLNDLRPGGQAKFGRDDGIEEVVDVVGDRGFLSAGTRVVVIEVHGNRIVVRGQPA
jgi:membrane-bound serine protease (ClpP class)